MSSDYTLMPFTYDRIAFPITDPRFSGNNSWTLLNADTSSAVLFAITFTLFFWQRSTYLLLNYENKFYIFYQFPIGIVVEV
jgi:hypothetical protein